MNDFSLLLRRLASATTLAAIFAAIGATTGCGAADDPAPADATGTAADPLLQVQKFCSSANTYTDPFYYLPQTTCAMQSTTILWEGRAFKTAADGGADAQAAFESRLAAHGCSTAVPDGKPASQFEKGEHFSISVCPDDCTTWTAVQDYANVQPVVSRMTRITPTSCLINNAGVAPAGKIYVIWDPLCGGTCKLQNTVGPFG